MLGTPSADEMLPGIRPRRIGLLNDWRALARLRAPTPLPAGRLCRSPVSTRWAATKTPPEPGAASSLQAPPPKPRRMARPDELAAAARESRNKFLSVDGIPAPQLTSAALQTCLRAATGLHPHLKTRSEVLSRSQALGHAAPPEAPSSRLAALGAERTRARLPMRETLQDAIDSISGTAYDIVTHANVEMTPEILELYVQVQARLGQPEPLPAVLELYATKPKPAVKNGIIRYVRRNPDAPSRAVEMDTAELALQTAIGARNLDAALGIIEATYALPAFRRQKLIKRATAPALALAGLPFCILGLATAYAVHMQNTMDVATATTLACMGISGYFLSVGSLGLIAKLSNKDHMRRVTWTPGTPLRYRWLREEERAALDKVACAWGFREPWRHGEETGADWEGLKEYMGYRQMLLDRVEFMDGMS